MKKFDTTPLLPFYDKAADLCRDAFRREEEVAPLGLLEELMDIPGMPMHCPPHHFLMPALLLVLAGRAQKIPYEQFEEDLRIFLATVQDELQIRGHRRIIVLEPILHVISTLRLEAGPVNVQQRADRVENRVMTETEMRPVGTAGDGLVRQGDDIQHQRNLLVALAAMSDIVEVIVNLPEGQGLLFGKEVLQPVSVTVVVVAGPEGAEFVQELGASAPLFQESPVRKQLVEHAVIVVFPGTERILRLRDLDRSAAHDPQFPR